MNPEKFIADKLRFQGRIAAVSVALSFFIIIVAVAVSSGFRTEIRRSVSSYAGDVRISGMDMNYYGDEDPIRTDQAYLDDVKAVNGVESVSPVIYRAGIVRKGDVIHGVLFKGVSGGDSLSLKVSIPATLARMLETGPGDPLMAYFVGDRVKVRKFTVESVYESSVQTGDDLLVMASIDDLRRLNQWEEEEVSALEITLDGRFRGAAASRAKAGEIGSVAFAGCTAENVDPPVVMSSSESYRQLFDWLQLIDTNVVAILVLMIVVAGFNMVSALLILLFRNVSTIGTLKSLGMKDRSISSVFMRVSSRLVLRGMLVGDALAFLFCLVQWKTHLIKLNPENYFVSFVPIHVNVPAMLVAEVIAFAVILAVLRLPCRFIAKVDPAITTKVQ